MTEFRVFVSHAYEDLDELRVFLESISYLPIELYIAVEDASVGRIPDTIHSEIENTDVVVPFLTDDSVDNHWVNQEIGCAIAHDLTVIPLFQQSNLLNGFISNMEGVSISYSNPHKTTFELLTRLRSIFSPPRGSSDWYLDIECLSCRQHNLFPIDQPQAQLEYLHEDGDVLEYSCSKCRVTHRFHPLSLHFLDSE